MIDVTLHETRAANVFGITLSSTITRPELLSAIREALRLPDDAKIEVRAKNRKLYARVEAGALLAAYEQ